MVDVDLSPDLPPRRPYWSSWMNTDENPCAWVGVSCTANFTVQELDFAGWRLGWSNLSLGGLFVLKDLRLLDLSQNYLNFVPDDIGNLTGLTFLDLSNNGLNEIPSSISACRSLRYLYLEDNVFFGNIPSLRGLVKLQVLSLALNSVYKDVLAGQFPKDLTGMRSLVSIDLSGNWLAGTIPSLQNLTSLVYLNLENNIFTEFEEPWLASTSLEHLLVSGNRLEGRIPPTITDLLNIVVLNMSGNRLSGTIPSGFSQLLMNGSIQRLDLSQNSLSGTIPKDLLGFSPMSTLVSLNLSHNSLTGSIPFSKQYSYNLLDLSHNQLGGPISFLFANKATSINSLFLQNNLLSEDIINFQTTYLCSATEVRLNSNRLTGDLSILSNRCLGIYMYQQQLAVLDLRDNNLQMSSLEGLANVMNPFLQELWLGSNNFSGISLPTEFPLEASGLSILDLSNNHLKGGIRCGFQRGCISLSPDSEHVQQ